MKNLLLSALLLMSFSALADLDWYLNVEKNIYETKTFKGGSSKIHLNSAVKCESYKAITRAMNKCREAGYSDCRIIATDRSGIPMLTGGSNRGDFFQSCSATAEGRKVKSQKSAKKILQEKCELIRECADNNVDIEELEVLSKLIEINKC